MDWSRRQPGDDVSSYAAGFVLAGGLSLRMGKNKALLPFNGQPLIERALGKLREVCPEVAIAGGVPELSAYGRIVPEEFAGQGPLSGIIAALEQSQHEWNLLIAVDMPALPVEALRLLLLASGKCLITLAEADGHVQPLCGVYSRRAAPALRAELLKGNLRVRAAVQATGSCRYWQAPELRWFTNVNTAEEFASAERLFASPVVEYYSSAAHRIA